MDSLEKSISLAQSNTKSTFEDHKLIYNITSRYSR